MSHAEMSGGPPTLLSSTWPSLALYRPQLWGCCCPPSCKDSGAGPLRRPGLAGLAPGWCRWQLPPAEPAQRGDLVRSRSADARPVSSPAWRPLPIRALVWAKLRLEKPRFLRAPSRCADSPASSSALSSEQSPCPGRGGAGPRWGLSGGGGPSPPGLCGPGGPVPIC